MADTRATLSMIVERVYLSAAATEDPGQIFRRVFCELKPRTNPPLVQVQFCEFANANSFIRLEDNCLTIRITDALERAPAGVIESLAHILLAKLYRKPLAAKHRETYRRYLNGKDVRRQLSSMRQTRGRKLASAPQGTVIDLEQLFDELNFRYFFGLMARPNLGWSLRKSRHTLGHYDPSLNTIILSKLLDQAHVPRLAVEYVMFHEMLHLRYPVDHRGARRCVHTPEFKEAERMFPGYAEAKELLKKL